MMKDLHLTTICETDPVQVDRYNNNTQNRLSSKIPRNPECAAQQGLPCGR